MLISGILLSVWIILFHRYYTFLFSIFLMFVFLMEIYINFLSISTYWFRRDENQSNLCSCFLCQQNYSLLPNIQFQNPIRRSMFLKIQNLFRTTQLKSTDPSDNRHHHHSLFDYRCPVCLNTKQDSFRWIVLGCGHLLCSLCIQHLHFRNKPICPNCRSAIILSDLTILYI